MGGHVGAWPRATSRSESARVLRFWLLARLFRAPSAIPLREVRALAAALDPVVDARSWGMPGLSLAAGHAESWCLEVANIGSLEAEHARLFGTVCCAPAICLVPATESLYLAEDPERHRATLTALYESHAFPLRLVIDRRYGPGHVSTELAFLAFLLEHPSVPRAVSRGFLRDHLSRWAMLFAVAAEAMSDGPVVRFASLALQHVLVSEIGVSTQGSTTGDSVTGTRMTARVSRSP